MPTIHLTTIIQAPIARVFDLERSIDLHLQSAEQTKERAIAGKTSGLAELNDTITWRAKHFGIYQNLTVQITEMDPPYHFVDEMTKGIFQSMRHEHRFKTHDGTTIMEDDFAFVSPFGIIGKLANYLVLTSYLRRFLQKRNAFLRQIAESETNR